MIKVLKKVNRGILLTVVILSVVIVYLIISGLVQAAEKPVIEEICRDYVETELEYSMLPEPWRSGNELMPQEELASYTASLESDIAPRYIENERIRSLALDRLRMQIDAQASGRDRILDYTKEISRFESFSFSGNEVTVVFKSRTAVERAKTEYDDGGRRVEETSDTIMLQKTDGEWKLVYATLYQPVSSYQPMSRQY